jgi:hypothetical protein
MLQVIRSTTRLLLAGLLVVVATGSPIALQAEEPASVPASLGPPNPDAPQIDHFEYWRARGYAARARVADTQLVLTEATAAVTRMRRDNHPRGEARLLLRQESADAQTAFDAATRYLEVELPAEARAAGVQQSWLGEPRHRP